jgi:hypothetical protein
LISMKGAFKYLKVEKIYCTIDAMRPLIFLLMSMMGL